MKKLTKLSDLTAWQEQLALDQHRGLIILSRQDFEWAQTQSESTQNSDLNQNPSSLSLSLGSEHQNSRKHSMIIQKQLGTECFWQVVDACQSFDPNLFCALNGQLLGGGLLLLLLDPEAIKHFTNRLIADPSQSLVWHQSPLLSAFIQAMADQQQLFLVESKELVPQLLRRLTQKSTNTTQLENQQQMAAIAAIEKVCCGRSRRPLVLTADRGRGKSAALGIAAANLMIQSTRTIIVTSPQLNNLGHCFSWANKQLTQLGIEPTQSTNRQGLINSLQLTNGSQLKFVPVDRLNAEQLECQLLMVDEAAAIPIPLLSRLNDFYNRIVYSTTTHGYEGNGQGFEVRFKQLLIERRPQTKFIRLVTPIRWAANDPMERALFSAFHLDCELEPIDPITLLDGSFQIQNISLQQLNCQVELATQIFALLSSAHYQTRPSDLERILTDSTLSVWVIRQQELIVGVALLVSEGGLSFAEIEQIKSKQLSLPGQLLPQSFLSRIADNRAGQVKIGRILRIAIHPMLQNSGLGTQLLTQLSQSCQNQYDYLGAAFSAHPPVLKFWLKQGFTLVGISGSKDASSGTHSAEVLRKNRSELPDSLIDTLSRRLLIKMQYQFNRSFSTMETELAKIILSALPVIDWQQSSDEIAAEIQQFVEKRRSLSQIADLLQLWIYRYHQSMANLDAVKQSLLVDYLFLGISSIQIQRRYQLTGKRAIQEKLRAIFHIILSAYDNKK